MGTREDISRRRFLVIGALTSGGLLLQVSGCGDRASADSDGSGPLRPTAPPESLNAFLAIGTDGGVTITVPCPEIGQGVRTSLARIVAEELGAAWEDVVVRQAEADERYGSQTVGGSDSVRDYWQPLREAGAAARAMLAGAAAERWGTTADRMSVADGVVRDPETGRSASFGELAEDAATRPVPEEPPLKDPSDFQLVGSGVGPVDAPEIVSGSAIYGLDVRLPDMLRSVVARAPTPGARVRSVDSSGALAVPGVRQVIRIDPRVPQGRLYGGVRAGVAVVAEDTWAAMRGREALEIDWDEDDDPDDSARITARLREAMENPGSSSLRLEGDPDEAFARASQVVSAEYELPMLAHLSMEPMNFTARVRDGRCDTWGPTQTPRALRQALAEALGLAEADVTVRPTLSGGGFGRRLAYDYGIEAALIAREADAPVQVVWTRDDDVAHDFFRPPSMHRLRAGLDPDGRVTAWEHTIATASLLENILTEPPADIPSGLYDVQGAADIPLAVPNVRVTHAAVPVGPRLGSWRSVSHSFNTFAVESFMSEIARARGEDPFTVRLELLGEDRVEEIDLPLPGRRGRPRPDTARLRNVLEVAARTARWEEPLPDGRGRGIACAEYKHSYAAHVVEMTMQDGRPKVERVVAVLDCGTVVNPSGARAQVEGSVMDGISTCLHWGIRFRDGRPSETNFDGLPMLRVQEAPEVEIVLVESDAAPEGAGEPPYPSVAPAVAAAWSDLTGDPVRALPITV